MNKQLLLLTDDKNQAAENNTKIRNIKDNLIKFFKGSMEGKLVNHISTGKSVISITEGATQ